MAVSPESLLSGSGFRAQLVRSGLGSVLLKAASVGLTLALAVVLARSLGPQQYGVYVYVYALVTLLAIPAQLGLPALVVRETANAEAKHQWGLMRGLWRWAALIATGFSLLLAVIAAIFCSIFWNDFSVLGLATFGWGLALVPLVALGSLRAAALWGLRKVVQSQLPEQIIRPAMLVLAILSMDVFITGPAKAYQAMALHVMAAAIAFAIGGWMLWRGQPAQLTTRPGALYATRNWFASALPFAVIAGMSLVNTQTGVVLLGIFEDAKDVGIYRVAAQGATLVTLGFTAIGTAMMPHFAQLHTNREMLRLQRIATIGARASVLLALPIVVAFGFFGATILGLVFGPGYAAGHSALTVLACAQLLNAAFGEVALLLSMTGYERDTAKGIGVAAVCNILASVTMIPLFGITGAALANGISVVIWNILMWRMVRHRLGIDSSIIGSFRDLRFSPH